MEVGRSLDEIDAKVKELNATLRESTAQTKEMDKALKLDPKATEVAVRRVQSLKTEIGLATQKVALMKQKQLEANQQFEKGQIGASEYNKVSLAVMRAENELRKYNKQLKDATSGAVRSQISATAQGFDKVNQTLRASQKHFRLLSSMAKMLVGALLGMVAAFTQTAMKLHEMAKACEVSIEKLQLQRNLYKQVTGDADNYNSTLDSLKKTLNKITLGQGMAYANVLKYIGVSTTDVNGKTKSLSQIYDEVLIALGGMEDITLRNQLAYELFGEEAINIVEILALTTEELEALNEAQIQQGIISEENAASALAIQEQWDAVKQQFMQVSAELAEKLLPLIKALADFVTQFILPILLAIANWFANMSPTQQKFVFFLLMLVILLPKIIAFITMIISIIKIITIACYGAAGGVGAVSTAALPLIPIILAVVAVVLILAIIFAFLTGRSKELSKSLDGQKKQMDGIASSYDGMGGDMNVTSNQVGSNSNNTTHDINVTIDSRGDNPIATENAELVADLLAERINKELGGKI